MSNEKSLRIITEKIDRQNKKLDRQNELLEEVVEQLATQTELADIRTQHIRRSL